MERTPVVSKSLVTVGYDDDRSVLEIETRDGSLERYVGVPASEFDALLEASTPGEYFEAHIEGEYELEDAS